MLGCGLVGFDALVSFLSSHRSMDAKAKMAARMAAFREDRAPKPKKFKPNSAESKKRKQDFDLIVSEKQKKAIPEVCVNHQ